MTTPCQQLSKNRFGDDVGADRWWRRVAIEGCPMVSAIGRDRARVLFLWRDPEGDATNSTSREATSGRAPFRAPAGSPVRWRRRQGQATARSCSCIASNLRRLTPTEPC